jgi:hypothetical protein
MKPLALLLLPILASAAEVTDLGVVSTGVNLHLDRDERRKDFAAFKVEILPRNLRGWTNKVEFTTTNSVLTLKDFQAVPDGPAILGIKTICSNGDASVFVLFKIDIQRDEPDPPKVHLSYNLRKPAEQKIEHLIQQRGAQPVPMPPLPGGTNVTYSQHQWKLEQNAREGKHRSN